MKIERTTKKTVVKVTPEVATITLALTGDNSTVTVSLSPKEARKLGKALRESAVIVSANGLGRNEPF